MKKTRSDSIIDGLPLNQQETLERWLFEENVSYALASERLLADFNVRCGQHALADFYQRTAQRRMLDRIVVSQGKKNAVLEKFKANPADTYQALLEVAGQIAFDKAFSEGKEFDAETIFNFTKLVMTGKKQAMEAEDLKLRKDKFEFDAAALCLKHLPSLRSIAAKSGVGEKEKIRQIRLQLFGSAPE